MKITLTVIKADIGSIGGHIAPSQQLLDSVRRTSSSTGKGCSSTTASAHTGDDIAILMTHTARRRATPRCTSSRGMRSSPAPRSPRRRASTAPGRIC